MTLRLIQAYRQTPWRTQKKWLGRFLLVAVLAVVLTGLYLGFSAQIAVAGIEIQDYAENKDELQREIADLGSQLAFLTSEREMESRARELGFDYIDVEQVQYLIVPGYVHPEPSDLAPVPGLHMVNEPVIKTGYTQSLWDWVVKVTTRTEKKGEES